MIEQPQYDNLELKEAANQCNVKILSCVDKCLAFVYHDSATILSPLEDFEGSVDIIRFYLDWQYVYAYVQFGKKKYIITYYI